MGEDRSRPCVAEQGAGDQEDRFAGWFKNFLEFGERFARVFWIKDVLSGGILDRGRIHFGDGRFVGGEINLLANRLDETIHFTNGSEVVTLLAIGFG